MDIRILRAAAYRRERWKNGLGWTHEIARGQVDASGSALADVGIDAPLPAEGWDWRLSIALIDRDCDFSLFPGIDRALVLIDGAGMRLDFTDGDSKTLTPADPQIEFAGERALACTLAAGPTRDFNAMWRRDRIRGRVERRVFEGTLPLTAAPGAVRALHLLAGTAGFPATSDAPLSAGDTAIVAGVGDTALEGRGELLIASFAPLS